MVSDTSTWWESSTGPWMFLAAHVRVSLLVLPEIFMSSLTYCWERTSVCRGACVVLLVSSGEGDRI